MWYSDTIKQGKARKGIDNAQHAVSYQENGTYASQTYRSGQDSYALIWDCGS